MHLTGWSIGGFTVCLRLKELIFLMRGFIKKQSRCVIGVTELSWQELAWYYGDLAMKIKNYVI